MPLAEFVGPEITDDYLHGLDKDQLTELLRHKTDGLVVAVRLKLSQTPQAKHIADEVQKIQRELEKRRCN